MPNEKQHAKSALGRVIPIAGAMSVLVVQGNEKSRTCRLWPGDSRESFALVDRHPS